MPRQARIVAPDQPHHVTQRGNRRAPIFFEPGDQAIYPRPMARETLRRDEAVWAYRLMPNHLHLIMTPRTGDALELAAGEAHRRYSNFVNARAGWTGHLFQSRFASVAMDEALVLAAARYVDLNPVRARLMARPDDWARSSVRAHLEGKDDVLVRVGPLLVRAPDFALPLSQTDDDDDRQRFEAPRRAEMTGRPAGDAGFVAAIERVLGRSVTARGRGRPAKVADGPWGAGRKMVEIYHVPVSSYIMSRFLRFLRFLLCRRGPRHRWTRCMGDPISDIHFVVARSRGKVLKAIFTWWYGATIGARMQIGRGGKFVGEDEVGNRYFETVDKRYDYDGHNRRFVIYKGYADASRVTPDWYGWLHHTFAEPPTREPLKRRSWEKDHMPNLTGTIWAWRPKGSIARGGQRAKASGDYQPWTPD